MDEITNDLDNIVFSFDKYSEEIENAENYLIKNYENSSDKIN